jgi:hypothetical protein
MTDRTNHAGNRPLRSITIAASCAWIAAILVVVFYAISWRYATVFLPRAPAGIMSLVLVVGTAAAALLLGIWRSIRGPRRLMALAVALLGATPLVWSGAFFADLARRANDREPLGFSAANCIAGLWASSLADAEARLRYPSWTSGRHATLICDGQTPEPARLAGLLDEHVEQMAHVLEQPADRIQVRWVRGALLWQEGRSMIDWALCGQQDHSADLTYLDRHESAHATITMLGGPDQQPPMLLCEGWAESQSTDRDERIRSLAQRKKESAAYSIEELVGPDWYNRSFGPVYSQGGPLCSYLIEHYGGKKFFALYSGVRQATFHDDAQRVLGDSWATVESQFWAWLNEQAESSPHKPPDRISVEFAAGVDRALWDEIVQGYDRAHSAAAMPDNFALNIEIEWSSDPADAQPRQAPARGLVPVNKTRIVVVRSVGGGWLIRTQYSATTRLTEYVVSTPDLVAHRGILTKGEQSEPSTGELFEVTATPLSLAALAPRFSSAWGMFAAAADPLQFLPLHSKHPYATSVTVESIERPSPPEQSLWKISCTLRYSTLEGAPLQNQIDLELDPAADWHVRTLSARGADGNSTEASYTLSQFFDQVGASQWTKRQHSNDTRDVGQGHARPLGADEIKAVQQEAESAARRPLASSSWPKRLLRPLTLAIAWPAAAILLILTDLALRRTRQAAG